MLPKIDIKCLHSAYIGNLRGRKWGNGAKKDSQRDG